jgi:hypothetical protein
MQAVLDPRVLAPPPLDEIEDWIELLDSLTTLAADGFCFTAPRELRDQIVAAWYEGNNDVDASNQDLARLVQELVARLSETAEIALMDNVTVCPEYVASGFDDNQRKLFESHVAAAAAERDQGVPHAGVLGPQDSWAEPNDMLLAEGELIMIKDQDHEWADPDEDEERLRAFIPLSHDLVTLMKRSCDFPCDLIQNLKIATTAYCVAELEMSVVDVAVVAKDTMTDSIDTLNYARDRRYAASCIRTMALIVAGRTIGLPGHLEREDSGPNEDYRRDGDGNVVVRTYLARRSPDAHRLFWVRTTPPVFLNVTTHEGTALI